MRCLSAMRMPLGARESNKDWLKRQFVPRTRSGGFLMGSCIM